MNNCVLLGRLVKDPELKYTQGGTAFTRFTLAVDRGLSKDKKAEMEQKGQTTADFIGITAWGKTAELAANYLAKGRQVAIQGRIQTGSYTKDDGTRVYTTDVVADRVEFIGGQQQEQQYQGSNNFGMDVQPIDSEDLPF